MRAGKEQYTIYEMRTRAFSFQAVQIKITIITNSFLTISFQRVRCLQLYEFYGLMLRGSPSITFKLLLT